MTRSRNSWRRMVLAALPVVLAACAQQAGSGEPPSSTHPAITAPPSSSGRADPAAVAWTGRLCETVGRLVKAIQQAPPGNGPATNGDDLKRDLSNTLGAAGAGLAAAAEQLGQLGSSPVPGGDQTVRELAAKYGKLVEPVNKAKANLDALPAGSGESDAGRIMGTVWPGVAAVGARPAEGVTIGPDIATAGTQSPACQREIWWRSLSNR